MGKHNTVPKPMQELREALQRSQTKLKGFQRRYSDLFEFAPIGYFTFDRTGQILEVNTTGAKLLGVERAQLLKRRFSEFIAPDFQTEFESHCKQVIETGTKQKWDLKLLRSDGEPFYAQLESVPVENEGGNVSRFRTAVMDITDRRQAEKALRESETRFRDLYDNAPTAYFSISIPDGSILQCNAAALCLLGYSKESLMKMKVFDLYADTPDGLSKAQKIFNRVKAAEPIRDVELQMKRSDGQLIWISLSTEPVKDHKGKTIKSRSMAVDISDHKRAEEAVVRERDNLINILDSMVDGVYIVNQKYDIEYINPTLIREFGPLDGNKCYEYLADRQEVCPWCKNQEIFAGQTIRWEWYSPKNLKTYDLMSTPLKNLGGSISKLEIFRDITAYKRNTEALRKARDELERRVMERTAELEKINKELRRQIVECELAEAALRESEQKYSTLVEDALIGVVLVQDGKIEFANDRYADIFGYAKNELIGMDSLDLVHPDDRRRVKEIREKRLKGQKVPSEYEVRGLKKKGETIWVMQSYSLITYRGKPAISGIVSDMTKRRQAEEALRESGQELRILSNQLLSAEEKERKRIARELHDGIGQALSAIKFSVENTLRELRKDSQPSASKSLDAVIPLTQKTIEEVRRIVKDLRPSILDDLGILATIGWFCREFQNVYSAIRIEKGIDIKESEIPIPLKTVIYRVLQEALNNVAKHSQADRVRLSLNKSETKINLMISDNGRGFDLEKTISLKSSRRGFGLASMRERAEISGGAFAVDSTPQKGTTIKIAWPLGAAKHDG